MDRLKEIHRLKEIISEKEAEIKRLKDKLQEQERTNEAHVNQLVKQIENKFGK